MTPDTIKGNRQELDKANIVKTRVFVALRKGLHNGPRMPP